MDKLKIRRIGNSLGAILPSELLNRLHVGEGDEVFVIEDQDGVKLTPYDPDFEEALEGVNNSIYGLQAGVFTNDLRKAFQAYEVLDVGGVILNDIPTFRIDHMPYGGVKESGFGREGLKYAIEEMTELKLLALNLNYRKNFKLLISSF